MKRKLYFIFVTLITGLIVSNTALAWVIELENSDGTLTNDEYYQLNIVFHGDATDNLNDYFLSVNYNTELLEFTTVQYYEYDDGAIPVPNTTWEGGDLPYSTQDEGYVYNIMGAEPLGSAGVYFPVASEETLLATLWFQATADGYYENLVEFAWSPVGDQVTVDGIQYTSPVYHDTLSLYEDGTSHFVTASPVPVPAAAWLLGSGLIGLIGIRRKTKA